MEDVYLVPCYADVTLYIILLLLLITLGTLSYKTEE
jgi:hypothetical protein